ncbi:MAG: hypothetical protein ACRDQB_02690 [Thermocrispum sp.]
MVGRELLRGAVVDESVVKQPLDSPALGSNITQGAPRRNQIGVVLIELVLESSERHLARSRVDQPSVLVVRSARAVAISSTSIPPKSSIHSG